MAYYLKFDLFDKTVIDTFPEMSQDQKASCSHYGRNYLWIGDLEGIIYRYNRDYTSSMFIGYEKCVNSIYQCKERDILITCGIDSGVGDVIKIWNLSKWSNQNVPSLIRKITNGSNCSENDFKVTTFDVTNNLNAIVLGLTNGTIEIIHYDLLNPKRSKRQDLHKMPMEKITNVSVSEDASNSSQYYIYATSNSRAVVLLFDEITAQIKLCVDDSEIGCPPKCSMLIDNIFFVTNNRGIYEVTSDGMGRCRALDGNKISIGAFKNYLIVVKLVTPSILSGTHLKRTEINQRPSGTNSCNYQVVIFDRINKIIAGEFPISDFNFLFVEWGAFYIYCGFPINKMLCFNEKDIQNKLKIFIQKNSFNVAISAAKALNFDKESIAEMYKQYGDHLYGQKNYEEAVNAYIETIGYLEPSFVIGKFLDPSNMQHLSKFVEALINKEMCTGEHLVLLFNCYIILKDRTKLDKLIETHPTTHEFDIDSIMNLMRKVSLYHEALHLAERYKKYYWYMKILIEDLKQHEKAIKFMSDDMPLKETEECLLTYGDILINIDPEVIAKQLERVCDQQNNLKLSITTILNVFANNRKGLKHFLASYISKTQNTGDCHIIYVNTYLELLLYEYEKEKKDGTKSAQIEQKIMEILTNERMKYSSSKVLISCYERGFRTGYRYLCELSEKYKEILNSYKLENDIPGMMETCYKFGQKDPELWLRLLEFLVDINAEEQYFEKVIQEIEHRNLMSPLMLLQKMTDGKNKLQFGLVKEYIMRFYERNERIIQEYKEEIEQLKEETKKNDDIVKCLNTEVQVFQNLKCSACTNVLDMPSVHFLCGHSYHMRCFDRYSNQNKECIKCSPNIEQLLFEINQWQTRNEKTTLTMDSHGPLHMEKLWTNILKQSIHPISIDQDPDQSEAKKLVQSSLENSNAIEKLRTNSNSVTNQNVSEKLRTNSNSVTNQNVSVGSTPESSKQYIPQTQKTQTIQVPQSRDKSASISIKESPLSKKPTAIATQPTNNKLFQTITTSNPFELETKPLSTSISNNPFDSLSASPSNQKQGGSVTKKIVGASPQSNKSSVLGAAGNPFGQFIEEKEKYPENKNPFGEM